MNDHNATFALGEKELLRAATVIVLIIGFVAVAVFGPGWLMSSNSDALVETPVCDLNAGPCQWKMNGKPWVAELEQGKVGEQGQEYLLRIHTSYNPDRFLAVLKGESMYLGEYPVPLKRAESDAGIHIWQATFVAPFCTTDPEMLWRIDFQQSNSDLDPLPLKLVFEAEGRGA